jgi:hypothetical protein
MVLWSVKLEISLRTGYLERFLVQKHFKYHFDSLLGQILRIFFVLSTFLSWGHFEGVGTQSLARPTILKIDESPHKKARYTLVYRAFVYLVLADNGAFQETY